MVFSLCVLAQSNAVTDRVLKKLSNYSPLLGRARWIGNFQSLAVTETYPCSSQGEALTPILEAKLKRWKLFKPTTASTCAISTKSMTGALSGKGFEVFLPLYTAVHR